MNSQASWQPSSVIYVDRPSKGMAVAAITLGVIGSVIGLIPILGLLAIPCGILAVIFGLVAVRKAKRQGRGGRAMGRAGWILGLVAVTFGIAGMVIVDQAFDDLSACLEGNEKACE